MEFSSLAGIGPLDKEYTNHDLRFGYNTHTRAEWQNTFIVIQIIMEINYHQCQDKATKAKKSISAYFIAKTSPSNIPKLLYPNRLQNIRSELRIVSKKLFGYFLVEYKPGAST